MDESRLVETGDPEESVWAFSVMSTESAEISERDPLRVVDENLDVREVV